MIIAYVIIRSKCMILLQSLLFRNFKTEMIKLQFIVGTLIWHIYYFTSLIVLVCYL